MTPFLSVVLPAYNEAKHIESNVIQVIDALSADGLSFEVIVVDDGSPDHTHVAAIKAKARHPEVVRVVRYDKNKGKGNALICGASYAKGSVVAFLDADMDLHPAQLLPMLKTMDRDGVDVIIGSKRHPDSDVDYPKHRWVLSSVYFLFIRILFGLPLRDTQTGIKVYRRSVVDSVFPRVLAKRFAFDIEVLAIAHAFGFSIKDAPIALRFGRSFSRIKPLDVYQTLCDTLAIFYRLRITRYYQRQKIMLGPKHPAALGSREVHEPDGEFLGRLND